MSNFGESWRIDGVTAAYVTRGPENGSYQVLFERCHAELPAIEAIRWDHPTVEPLRTDVTGMVGLPAGCGFTLRITPGLWMREPVAEAVGRIPSAAPAG